MANPTIETVSTGADKAKLAGVAVLVVGAVVAFYALVDQDLWLRVLALLACSLSPWRCSSPRSQASN
jgi:preprotein translocase subunit SecE